MTKIERAMLQALAPQVLSAMRTTPTPRPAHASGAPAWVTEAKAATAPSPSPSEPQPDRVWTFKERGSSKSGRDTVVFSAGMRNGGTFDATLPGDLVRALIAGKVVGMTKTN